MRECIDVIAKAMSAVSSGQVASTLRTFMPVSGDGALLAVMPAASESLGYYGTKVLSLTPANSARGLPFIRGQFLLFEAATGAAVAAIDAASLTTVRTAAASGLATRLLARPESRTCGIFGTGIQAESHLDAICEVRDIEEVRVWGRSHEKAVAWADAQRRRTGRRVVAWRDPEDVAGCDVVCTATASRDPILEGKWVEPGAHVNLVGAHTLTTREADSALIARSRVYVDLLESARNEAGDLMIPIAEGAVRPDHVLGEIGKVLSGELAGRTDPREITVYKSVGIAAQDLYAAWHVFRKATAAGGGASGTHSPG